MFSRWPIALTATLRCTARSLSSSSAMATSAASARFSGQVAIVTASTEGIGLAIARRLARDGCKVMVSSRKDARVKRAVQELKAEGLDVAGVVCHVGKEADRRRLVDETLAQLGPVDILVSNAAANPYFGPILDCSGDTWDKIFDINVKSALLLAQLVVPEMVKRGKGSVVFVASIAGYQPIPFLGPYSVSKTALLGLTKALSAECAAANVRVNCISPGIVQTKFAQALTENETFREKSMEQLHIKRFATPEDIAGTASFLCSDEASYITGESLIVSGGLTSRL